MTKVEIAVSVGVTIWMIIAIVLAVGLHKLVKPEYRKFYPHPSVGVILDNKYDYRLNKREKAFCNILSIIVFIPITFEWVVAWCLYKLGGAVYKFIKEADEIVTEFYNEKEDKTVNENSDENINNNEEEENLEEISNNTSDEKIKDENNKKEEIIEDVQRSDSDVVE